MLQGIHKKMVCFIWGLAHDAPRALATRGKSFGASLPIPPRRLAPSPRTFNLMKNLDALKQHGDVIWNIANLLRGPYRPPQYRRVMIPLTVLRRLDCVLEETKDQVIALYKKLKAEKKHDAETIEKMINRKFKLNFHNTSEFTFAKMLGDQ